MNLESTELKVSVYQADLIWEDKNANLEKLGRQIQSLSGTTDLLVVPEMYTTGFSMNCDILAETVLDQTINTLKRYADQYKVAVCGSFIAKDEDRYYNRAFFVSKDQVAFYDKRHLFRMGNESDKYTKGSQQTIVSYKGFNICLQVCYDLRFPVWSRNVNNAYDLLIYVANWPQSRIKAWDILLKARAIENCAYVCGANRIGVDGYGLTYNGHSTLLNYKGEELLVFEQTKKEQIKTHTINKNELNLFRYKFPVWQDTDEFYLK